MATDDGFWRMQYEPTMNRLQGGDFVARTRPRTQEEEARAEASTSTMSRSGSRSSNAENDGGRYVNGATGAKRMKIESGLGFKASASTQQRSVGKSSNAGSHASGGKKLSPATMKSPNAARDATTPRQRPTNNQLLYRINFHWEHYEHAIPAIVKKQLPKMTEACPSVTSAFLQTLRALDMAESQRTDGARNILQLLSVNTRRTKVVALNSGTHRVPEELRRHQLSDAEGNEYSTNLDRNRYGNDDNYLWTVTRFNLQALELCPLLAQVQIIGTKGNCDDVLLTADKLECGCGSNRKGLSNHWTVPAFVLPSQMPTAIPKSTLAAKDRSRKKARQSLSSVHGEMTPEHTSDDDQHAGMGVLLDALTSVGGIPMSPVKPSRMTTKPQAPVMSPSRPIRGIRQVELDLGAINEDTALAQEQIAQATRESIDQIPDGSLRDELHGAITRSCELHMTAAAAQLCQHKAEREAAEYKVLVGRLEQLLSNSETAMHQLQIQMAKMKGEGTSHGTENDRVIQGSAILAHKLIGMQQSLSSLTSRFDLMCDQSAPRSVIEELLRSEMAAHLVTNKALLRAETSLAAYAAAEATCDEEIWRTQYVKTAQRNLEKAAYAANASIVMPTEAPIAEMVPPAPVVKAAPAPAFMHSEGNVKYGATVQTPKRQGTAPRGIKSIAIMADAVASANIDASHLPPETPLGAVKPMRHAFISPP